MMISRKEFRFICFVIAFAGNLSIEGRADNQLDQMDGNILINASMFGLISVIPLLAVVNGLSAIQVEISAYLFGGAVLTSAISTFIGSVIRRRPLLRSAKDALSGMCCFVLGGLLPFVIGITVPNRIARDISLFGVTAAEPTSPNVLDPRSLNGIEAMTMMTVFNFVVIYMFFLEALFCFYVIVDTYYYKERLEEEKEEEEEEEEDDDIELGDDDHCCRLCHEDVRVFSNILRLSKCHRIRSRFTQLKKD